MISICILAHVDSKNFRVSLLTMHSVSHLVNTANSCHAKYSTGLAGPVKDTPLPLRNYRTDEKQVTLENKNYDRNEAQKLDNHVPGGH